MYSLPRRVAIPLGKSAHVGEWVEREPQRVVRGSAIMRERGAQHVLGIVAAEIPKALAIAPR
jgi:hypothetical protein